MPLKPTADNGLKEASKSACRCTQCGGQAKLWSDRWACPECGYFDFVAAAKTDDPLGNFEETETFEGLVDKAHFWSKHAQAGGGSHQANSLAHAALYVSRALRVLAMKIRMR